MKKWTNKEIENTILVVFKTWNITDPIGDFKYHCYAELILDDIWEKLGRNVNSDFNSSEWQHYARTFDFKNTWKEFNPEYKGCTVPEIIMYLRSNVKAFGGNPINIL